MEAKGGYMNLRSLINRLTYGFFVLVELFLGLRLILKLFGANAENGFVNWVYETSGVLLDPFRSIFPAQVFKSTFVLELSTIFAMIIYAVLVMLLIYLVDLIARATTTPAVKKK
jgi:hypothetical protein